MTQGLIIDNFAGGGGASLGLAWGMGRQVDEAINHDRSAIAMHEVNHPDTRHHRNDVWEIDPVETCAGRPVDLLWFSPDCKHFSKAKGAKPVEKKIRDLAWVAVKWVEAVKVRQGLLLENVEEFQDWGPLIETEKGLMPCPERKGLEFRRWVKAIRDAGATSVEWRELRACDYGAPTIRKRLFLIARFDGKPIIWPKPTHGPAGSGLLPFKTAADCIDWSIPCPSIFDRKQPLKPATCRRIAAGIMKFVVNTGKPFIVPITHTKAAPSAQPIDEPLRTITTAKGGEFALATPLIIPLTHQGNDKRVIDIEAPLPTITGANRGEMALVAAFLAQHNTGVVGRRADAPLSTVTQTGSHQQIVTSHLMKLYGTTTGQPVDEPMHTITAVRKMAEVRAFLCKYYGNDENGQGLDEPMHTVTTKDRFGLVTVQIEGEPWVIVDIGMRMLTPRELARAQGFPDSYILDPVCEYETESGRLKTGPLPKVHQIARIGNSVCPVMAEVLSRANFAETVTQIEEVAA